MQLGSVIDMLPAPSAPELMRSRLWDARQAMHAKCMSYVTLHLLCPTTEWHPWLLAWSASPEPLDPRSAVTAARCESLTAAPSALAAMRGPDGALLSSMGMTGILPVLRCCELASTTSSGMGEPPLGACMTSSCRRHYAAGPWALQSAILCSEILHRLLHACLQPHAVPLSALGLHACMQAHLQDDEISAVCCTCSRLSRRSGRPANQPGGILQRAPCYHNW